MKKLTAAEVIKREALDPKILYMQVDTGSVATGEEWNQTFRWLEESGQSECDDAFDPEVGAHLEPVIVDVDELLEWGDNYDGELEDLNEDDYNTESEMQQADEERRRQYWRLSGTVAIGRETWETWLTTLGIERGSESWAEAEKIAARFRDIMDANDPYWPIDCYVNYERGDGEEDDTIEGAGSYSVVNL